MSEREDEVMESCGDCDSCMVGGKCPYAIPVLKHPPEWAQDENERCEKCHGILPNPDAYEPCTCLVDENDHLRDQLTTAERERDEARRERDANGWQYSEEAARHSATRHKLSDAEAAHAELKVQCEGWVKQLDTERESLRTRAERAEQIILWALGENGDFPERPERIEGKPYPFYWWRSEMRKRFDALDDHHASEGEG